MTFLPIVDTIQGDVTGYIPSNLISMTDGQIYLDTALFNSGTRPAIDMGLSVSRIGNKVQCPIIKELSSTLRLEYLRYNELLKVTRFKANVSPEVGKRLRAGEVLVQIFSQENSDPYSLARQVILLYALKRNILNDLSKGEIAQFKNDIYEFASSSMPDCLKEIGETKELTDSVRKKLDECFVSYFKEREIIGEPEEEEEDERL